MALQLGLLLVVVVGCWGWLSAAALEMLAGEGAREEVVVDSGWLRARESRAR